MEISNEYCDLENEEGDHKPLIKKCLRHKSSKKTLETNSTSSCTFEIEKLYLTPCSKSKKNSKGFSICKSHKKHSNIAERLNYLQQITDNKVKFMRIEKELKEISDCTFKPKTNVKETRWSLIEFSKQQEEYTKSKNSHMLKLRLKYKDSISTTTIKKNINKNISTVHDRLYKQSKLHLKREF